MTNLKITTKQKMVIPSQVYNAEEGAHGFLDGFKIYPSSYEEALQYDEDGWFAEWVNLANKFLGASAHKYLTESYEDIVRERVEEDNNNHHFYDLGYHG